MRTLWIISAFCIAAMGLRANEISDLSRMNKFYQSQKKLFMEFDVVMKYEHTPKPEERQSCVLSLDQQYCYYKVLHTEYLNDGKYSLFVDHAEKLMVVSDYEDPKEREKLNKQFNIGPAAMDTLELKRRYTVRYTNAAKNTIVLIPKGKDDEYDQIEIQFNPDYSLSRVVYIFKKQKDNNPRMTSYAIVYKKQKQAPESRYFNSGKYVHQKKGKLCPADKLAAYRVIDKRKATH